MESSIDQIAEDVIESGSKSIKFKIILGVVVLGTTYLMGVRIGANAGRTFGRLEGYSKATEDIAKIVKEAKKHVDK